VQIKSKVIPGQIIDFEIQRDLIEVWLNIKESIRLYELTQEKQNMIRKSDKNRTIINLNLKL
jgi:hypothetical protein